MRHLDGVRSSWELGTKACLALATGCTLVLDRDARQCESHADCQALGRGYVCALDQVCVPFDVIATSASQLDGGGCIRDADCVGLGLAVCRTGACLPLNAPEHLCVSASLGTTSPADGSPPLVVGMLGRADDLYPTRVDRRITGPVGTAINELNRARAEADGSAIPALVGIACDQASPSAVEYMVRDLQVDILIGPAESNRVEAVLNQIGESSVLWAPFADAPNLQAATSAPASWLVGCRPNRAGMGPYFLSAIAEVQALARASLGTVSPVIAVSGDVVTTEFMAGFDALTLEAAELRAVPYAATPLGRGLVSALEGIDPYPNLVVAASAEDDWAANIAALDRSSHEKTGGYPYYLLAEKRVDTYLQAVNDQTTADGALLQYRRLMGLDYHRDALSTLALADFTVAHRGETGTDPEPGVEYAYDCAYLAVYAAIAASRRYAVPVWDLPSSAHASGLSALMESGPLLAVGESTIREVVANLVANRGAPGSVNLVGSSGALELVGDLTIGSSAARRRYLAPQTPDGELYCIDASSKAFCDTGILFSASNGVALRPLTARCTCLGSQP